MSKTILIHAPVRAQDRPRHIPYGLAILANIIRDKHEVAICDMNINRMNYGDTNDLYNQYLRECLEAAKWDYIGVGGLSSQYKDVKKILPMAKKTNPQATIIAGGGWITYIAKDMMELNPEVDIASVGESFDTLPEILDGKAPRDIKSIYYREDGQLIATPPRGLYHDVDKLPYPAYDLLDMEMYFKNSSSNECVESMNAKRRTDGIYEYGCPRSCHFCSHNGASRYDLVALYGKERVRELDKEAGYFQNVARWQSPKYIVENTWYLYNKYQLDFLTNMDENMCSNRKRVFELCDRLISEGLNEKVLWGALGDTASVDDEMISKMKESGCRYISFGGESASDRILLHDIQKGVTRAHAQEAVDVMKRCQMRPLMTFQIGFPTETVDDILETTSFFVENNIRSDCFISTAYPGTQYYMEHKKYLMAQYDPLINQFPDDKEREKRALERFLIDLDDATDMTATVAQNFNQVELLGIKSLVANNDIRRILLFAHDTNRTHATKWNAWCDYCKSSKEIIVGSNN